MRALDGTYWRLRSNDETIGEYSTIELAYPMASQLGAEYPNVTIVRIRPRMSIVRAVRLLVEARAKGVELWMRRADMPGWIKVDRDLPVWATDDFAKPGTHATSLFQVYTLLTRWIVATPQDARRIDARGKK